MQRSPGLLILLFALVSIPVCAGAWPPNGAPLCTATNHQNNAVIASDGSGGGIVAWVDFRSGNADIYAQRINASGLPLWTPNGVAVCIAADAQEKPKIVVDGTGGAVIVWEDFRNGSHYDVYAQRVNALGVMQWTLDGVPVCEERFDQREPIATPDGSGGALVAWPDARPVAGLYAQHVGATGISQWTTNGVLVCNVGGGNPALVVDGAGGAILLWEDYRLPSGFADIYAQRLNASGTIVWPLNGVPVCTAADHQFFPKAIVDDAGGAIATWIDFRDLPGGNIYTQRIDGTGATIWTNQGVYVAGPADTFDPTIVPDGVNGAIIAWIDDYVGHELVYTQHVDADGNTLWTTNGIELCGAFAGRAGTQAAPDGAGGAVVTWWDQRSAVTIADIYAARIDYGGNVLWTTDGAPVCTASGHQIDPVIVASGTGGALIAWVDERSGISQDIYAQRLAPNGMVPTGVRDTPSAGTLSVQPNAPNPFAESTNIDIEMNQPGVVSLEIYDAGGRRLRGMSLGLVAAGTRRVVFDGRGDDGRVLPSGVYFCRIATGSMQTTQKIVLTR